MIVNVGEIVRITESAREEMLACRQEGPDTDAIRENRVGAALEQVGARVGQQSSSPYRMSTLIECDEWSKRVVSLDHPKAGWLPASCLLPSP